MKTPPAVFYTSSAISVLVLSAMLCASPVSAEKIYKSTNARGEVVFSDEPPPNAVNVEQIEVQPAPTETEHRAAEQRTRRMESMAEEMESARKERTPEPAPVPAETPAAGEEVVETYVDGDYAERERRRRALAGDRPPRVEHRAPARAVPHAGGGGHR